LQEAVSWFEQAAGLMPEQSRVFYNWAIALQTLDRPQEAESAYEEAISLDPRNGDYLYGIITLYLQQEQYESALEYAEELNRLFPNNPNVQQILQLIEREM